MEQRKIQLTPEQANALDCVLKKNGKSCVKEEIIENRTLDGRKWDAEESPFRELTFMQVLDAIWSGYSIRPYSNGDVVVLTKTSLGREEGYLFIVNGTTDDHVVEAIPDYESEHPGYNHKYHLKSSVKFATKEQTLITEMEKYSTKDIEYVLSKRSGE